MSNLFPDKETAKATTVTAETIIPVSDNPIEDGYLLYSKRQKIELKAGVVKFNDVKQEIPEGDNAPEYALRQSRFAYERYLRDCLMAENLIILTGAGSSMGLGSISGVSMRDLWNEAEKKLGKEYVKFCELVYYTSGEKNLEALLTHAELYLNYNEKIPVAVGEKESSDLTFIRDKNALIKELILDMCNFADRKDGATEHFNESVHLNFLQNISYRKSRLSRPKIFTTNYDRAFEVAASSGVFIAIDGFSFDSRRVFNGKFYDFDVVLTKNNRVATEDNFAPNVIHLYKLHGSIDWFQEGHNIFQRYESASSQLPLMIFPNRDKFQLSYYQPYFEMMSRFQNELRKSSSTTLVIIGYSFGDDHINRVIEEALRHNAFLKIVIVDKYLGIPYSADTPLKEYLQRKADLTEQVIFIRDEFKDFVTYMPSPKERAVEAFGENDDSRAGE